MRPILLILICLLPTPAGAVDVLISAVAGEPYGVATIEIPLARPLVGQTLPPIQAIDASDTQRILYPFSEDIRVDVPRASETPVPAPGNGRLLGRLGSLIREIANPEPPQEQTVARRVSFLFTGDAPLTVRLTDGIHQIGTYPVAIDRSPQAWRSSLDRWWSGYADAAGSQEVAADYPTLVEDYLIAMLSRRLNLALPTWFQNKAIESDELLESLKLIAGGDGLSRVIFRRAAVGSGGMGAGAGVSGVGVGVGVGGEATATLALPPPPRWAPLFDDASMQNVAVEPMATHVPPEWFYIRYGSFENYTWFSDLSNQYGGDLSSMVTLRGIETGGTKRIEQQLHLQTTQLARLLGPQVIADQAIVGRDLFLTDGASLGVMFQAKNSLLLKTSLSNDRNQLAASDDGVTLKDINVDGTSVSFLSTPDNRVRSYMIQQSETFLVTNSLAMVKRFLEVERTGQSLAATPSFQLARTLMPIERNDTVFAYFSPEMLRGLVSPEYLIELRRRLAANSEIAMLHLARMSADQSSVTTASADETLGIDSLIAGGFLPRDFGLRGDGSGAIEVGNAVLDSRRGGRGNFLPIADVSIDGVTPDEAAWYGRIADTYERRFPTIDPIMVGVQRETVDQTNRERILFHAEIAPLGPEKYGKYAKYLGPPTNVAMQFAPDDIIAAQAHVAADALGPPTHLFAAVKDTVPPDPEELDGILNIYRSLRGVPGYIGAWPQPGMLDRLPLGLGRGQPVGPGLNRLIGGLYRYSDGQFSILSFQPDVLQASLPFLAAIDADDGAQVRLRSDNLQGSRIERYVNAQLYDRARQSSVAGASLLSLMSRQLGVAPEKSPDAVRQVLGVDLQCTLGGDYVYSDVSDRWISTAWKGELAPATAPPDYVAPPMKWFRGANAKLTQYADRLVADATIEIER